MMKNDGFRGTLIMVVVTAMILATPLAAAGAGTEGDLFVQETEGLGPSKSVGGLQVLTVEQQVENSGLADPAFSLDADILRVETDRSEVSAFQTRALTGTHTDEYRNPRVEGLDTRENYQFSVWPTGSNTTIRAEDASCVTFTPSETAEVSRPPLVEDTENRDLNRAEVADSFRWQGCDRAANLTIQGDFLLRLWEWDAEMTADGETRILRSGTHNHESLPGEAPDASDIFGKSQEQFLFATNATLTIPHLKGHYELYMDDMESTASSGFRMSSATGSIFGYALDQQDLFVTGADLKLHSQGTGIGRPLAVALNGDIDRIEIDGQSVDSLLEPDSGSSGWGLPFATVALAAAGILILVGTVTWHTHPGLRMAVTGPIVKRRNNLFNEAVTEAMEYSIDRPRRGRKWARIAMHLKPNHPEALAAMGTVYFHLRRYKKALKCFERAIVNVEADFDPNVRPEETVPMWAVYCARSLGGLRVETRSPAERDLLGEKILWYARIAAEMDPVMARGLITDGYMSDLWSSMWTMMELERHGVTR